MRWRNNQSGVALGPILWVLAVIAVLAAVIAAGSRSFNANTTNENVKAQAEALIQIADNLKIATDRVVNGNGISPSAVTYGTTLSSDLFSPIGGGIAPPSTTFLAQCSGEQTDHAAPAWHFMYGTPAGFGTSAGTLFAFGTVASKAVCDEINALTNGQATPTAYVPIYATGNNWISATNWPLPGIPTGCFYSTHIWSIGYWFYQALAIQ